MKKKYKPACLYIHECMHKRDHIMNDKRQEWKIISEAKHRGKKIGEEEGKK